MEPGCLGHSAAVAQNLKNRAFAALRPGHPMYPIIFEIVFYHERTTR